MLPVAESLRASGCDVRTPAVPGDLDAFTTSVGAAVGPDSVVVGYSAAGPRLFHLAQAARPAALIFLDARLPEDDVPADAEPKFASFLDSLPTEDGLLPPWAQWWPDVMVELIPDDRERERFAAGCPRLPRSLFSQPIPAPSYDGPCGFVGFGDGYAADAGEARRRGWPVTVLDDAHHLWPLVEPNAVAEALVDVIGGLVG